MFGWATNASERGTLSERESENAHENRFWSVRERHTERDTVRQRESQRMNMSMRIDRTFLLSS